MAEIIHNLELGKRREIKRLRDELWKNPQLPELYYELGKLLVMGLFPDTRDEGIKHLEKAIKLKPDFVEALELLFHEIMESNPLKGSRLAQKAASIYKERNDFKKANEILNKAATHYVYQGWEFLEHGMEREALKKAGRALKIFPDCVDAMNIYGSIHLDRFEFDEAEKFYRQALKKAIEQQDGKEKINGVVYWGVLETRPYMRSRHGIGLTYIFLGKFGEALSQFKKMLELNPNDNQGARFLLGDVCLFMNDIEQAEQYYKEYGGEGRALFFFIKGEKVKAIKEIQAMKKENPFIVKMLISYFDIFFKTGLWKELGNDPVKIFQEPKYEYLMVTVWNENVPRKMDYLTHKWFTDACEFCKLYGPLWLKYKDIYDLLMEIEHGITKNN